MTEFVVRASDFILTHIWGGPFLERLLFAALWGGLAAFVADRKHRSAWAWGVFAAGFGYWLEVAGGLALLAIGRLSRVDLRRKYLEMRAEDQLFQAMGGPSLVGDNLDERILMVLANNPKGLRVNALAQGVGQSWRAIEAAVEKLFRKGTIRKDGELYFLRED